MYILAPAGQVTQHASDMNCQVTHASSLPIRWSLVLCFRFLFAVESATVSVPPLLEPLNSPGVCMFLVLCLVYNCIVSDVMALTAVIFT